MPSEETIHHEPVYAKLEVIVKNALANLARLGAGWLIVLLLPPLLVRELDQPSYATWLLILQLGAYVTVFDGGVQGAVARFVARFQSAKDERQMTELLSSTAFILLIGAIAFTGFTALIVWQLPRLFREIPSPILPSARNALLVVGLSICWSLPFSILAGYFLGLQKNELPAVATTVGKFLGAAGIAWVAFHHKGLVWMGAWTAVGNLFPCGIYVMFWSRAKQGQLFHVSQISRRAIREFLFFFVSTLAAIFSGILISGLDLPIVTAFDFRSAAYYGVATTLSNMLLVPFGAMVSTIMPVTSGMSIQENPARIGDALLRTSRYAVSILWMLAFPLLFGMKPFLQLWVGSDYAAYVLPLAQMLVIAQCIRMTMLPYVTVAFSTGQQQRTLFSGIAEGIVNLTISIVAVRYFGALGVALGTLVGAVMGVMLHFLVSMRLTDTISLSRPVLVWRGILRPAACILPATICLLAIRPWTRSIGIGGLMITVGELIAIASLWKWNFDQSERDEAVAILSRIKEPFLRGNGSFRERS